MVTDFIYLITCWWDSDSIAKESAQIEKAFNTCKTVTLSGFNSGWSMYSVTFPGVVAIVVIVVVADNHVS